jgi:hypothetical protein
MVLGVALLGAALRGPLLWDDAWAPGYDGGYYVLQVRSWIAGEPLFADRSLVYPVLALITRVVGDVVLGNKLAAAGFAGLTAGLGALGGWRWTGSRAAGLALGVWWACSPMHLGVSSEFLKNSGGLVVLAGLFAALPRCEERRSRLVLVLALVLLGGAVHKLTGALGVLLVGGYASQRFMGRWVWAALGVAALGALGFGVLRPVDLMRFGGEGIGRSAIWSGLLGPNETLEALAVHAAPLAVLGLCWHRRAMGAGLVLVALACTAPGLPFGWDLTSWRLVLMGFIPLGACAAMLAERTAFLAVPIAVVAVAQAPSAAEHQAQREPDYAAWRPYIEVIQATVPPSDRVVAHRGLCGFVWAAGDRVCENFQPQGDLDGWWRIGFGMGAQRLDPYCETVPLLAGYTLVPETCWQAFRADHVDQFSLLKDPRNPFEPRPAFVYGPKGDTPDPSVKSAP